MASPPPDPPISGVGRGGRGAALLEALKKAQRRPGQGAPSQQPLGGVGPQPASPIEPHGIPEPLRVTSIPAVSLGKGEARPVAPLPTVPLGRAATLTTALHSAGGNGARPGDPLAKGLPESGMALPIGRGFLGRGLPITPAPTPEPARPEPPRDTVSEEQLSEELGNLSVAKQYSGTVGEPATAGVNYIRVQILPGKETFIYHVSFNPQVDSKGMRFKLINSPPISDRLGGTKMFDGAKIYLPLKFPDTLTTFTSILPTDGSAVTVTFKRIHVCQPADYIHLCNILMRRIFHILKLTQVGRYYYQPSGGIMVPQHKLEIWPGFITAIDEYQGGLMLNCDSSFKVLRTVTARDVLVELHHSKSSNIKDLAEKQLLGSIILTRYNNKTYRVDDIDWKLNPRSSFTTDSGQEQTFIQYYRKQYDIKIEDEDQPLLISRCKPRKGAPQDEQPRVICLVPELSYMTGLTDEMRADFKVMRDVAVHTRINPNQRVAALNTFLESVISNTEVHQLLRNWGLALDTSPLDVPCRILPQEEVFFRNKSIIPPTAEWGREAGNEHVIKPVHFDQWLIIFTRRDQQRANEFIVMLKKVCPNLGIQVRDPHPVILNDDRTDSFLRAIKDNVNPQVQFVVIIFPTSRDDRYSAVKKLCCVEMPVPSQVIIARTIAQYQKLRSVTQKVALQINCKLGGELWALRIPLKSIMVCGIDVYHDSSRKGQSVIAFLASTNATLTRWYSRCRIQDRGQELADCLKLCLLSALKKFHEVNHTLPDRIFIFRDGVSDGQLDYVSKYEVEQLSSCFTHLGPTYDPGLSVIIVQKRINTRIFLKLRNQYENPPPGTVVDHTITRKLWFDFFLVSQHVLKGTVSPTHYIVIHDSNGLKPDHMQRLSYKLTHLYYNWPGTVRVPAPCQYAHKLAFQVGQSIHKEPSPELEDKLYFL